MKAVSTTILALLALSSSARFLDATNVAPTVAVTYASNLNCGQCIYGGYIYCRQGAENLALTGTTAYPSTNIKCCNPSVMSSCTEVTNTAYNCSSSYADRSYAKYVCPQKESHCGTIQTAALVDVNSTYTFNISALPLGRTCAYAVATNCGAPAFTPNDTSRVEIEYVEFRFS
jgi:hypothetical protein